MSFNVLDHLAIRDLSQAISLLKQHGCEKALLKKLAKNNNDKQQIYFHHDASLLNAVFDMTFFTRERSQSKKRGGSIKGKRILSAVFNNFQWLGTDHSLHEVTACKGVVYAQYPEVRLSGFKAETGIMPRSLSLDYVKENLDTDRYLVIGATPEGKAIAMMVVSPSQNFVEEFLKLPFMANSKICRLLKISEDAGAEKLLSLLKLHVGGKSVKGCRLDAHGKTLPFTGTQVHGYTLEHELGIRTNASKDGDIFGIELKCFTSKKLTLFTPEPDGGLYSESFSDFMQKYGYEKEAVYRLTGLHRAGSVSEKSGLSLRVLCTPKDSEPGTIKNYNPEKPLSHQLENLSVVLVDDGENIAASWSVERLLNNWGVKHNESVYVPAKVTDNDISHELDVGYTRRVTFGNQVLWCKKTSLERMIRSIASGVIFLDPAPKYDPDNPRNNKRRSQWRINNIYRDSQHLYEEVKEVDI
ncbi:MvaI/BcnI restriction endonuclease family [Spongiibacter sp. IMCC21906]|uniref:MvaI/BcnI family restriction endonuclease n=1 Tax=Spongiibacter sp. IMCC21906 TaxID=1620392 RepID=UPI00062DE564|nr:MvaI/BcnI family restriction endonuclease [Spongiibacter sp. IMCC21906]AKH68798.1 MvaI/BcnI restriction endonuclease family [Spongiibacter sp. IMCC21906]